MTFILAITFNAQIRKPNIHHEGISGLLAMSIYEPLGGLDEN
jgi:hypothetical protein